MYDLVITNGTVYDGISCNPRFDNIFIKNGIIENIGNIKHYTANQIINADGMIVSPGFIDMHSHDDFHITEYPESEGKLSQGVTTIVNGNCGYSPAPINNKFFSEFKETVINLDSGLPFTWNSMNEYLKLINNNTLNIIQLVGHHTLRCSAMGLEDKKPTEKEFNTMQQFTEESMKSGSFGLSTGFFAPPSCYADPKEIINLLKIVKKYNGSYHTHMRNEGTKILDAIEETVQIAKQSNVTAQISHLKISNPDYHGNAEKILNKINSIKKSGVDLYCDQYPYIASSGSLKARLPLWVQKGSNEDIKNKLMDPHIRKKIQFEIEHNMRLENVSMRIYDFSKVFIALSPSEENFIGMTLYEMAQIKKKSNINTMLDLLISDNMSTRCIYFHMCDEDVENIMKDQNVAIGSDGLYMGNNSNINPHPRHYGTFSRVLGKYVRDKGVISLSEAINKMTSLPAKILKLKRRGVLIKENYADITIFDMDKIIDRSTFEKPFVKSNGIEFVIINGIITYKNNFLTGDTPGLVLKRNFNE